MEEVENITLSLPRHLLCRVEAIVAERKISLAALVTEQLSTWLTAVDRYTQAQAHYLASIEEGDDRGTHEPMGWTREELYER